jgi:uncharacterized protein YktA (UPF0223 family)
MSRMDIIGIIVAAINNVPSSYYVVHNPEERNGQIIGYSKDLTQAELSFVTRFYHEIMKIFESSAELNKYIDHYKMDTELYKKIIHSYSSGKPLYNKTREKYVTETSQGVYPDFVFHKGQEFNRKEDQLLSIEFKAKPIGKEDFEYDLFKTNLYIEELNFQHGAYIVVNNDNQLVHKLFKEYRQSNYHDEQKCKVICKQDYESEILVVE